MIWFPKEGETDAAFADKDLADISKSDAVFIKIPFTEDREESPWAEKTVVPTSRLLSDNPSRDYDVPVGRTTILVTDSYGNEYFRLSSTPKADRLRMYLKRVQDQAESANDKLEKYLEKAREELEDGDRRKALRYLLRNFDDGDGPVGLEAQEESIRLYHSIMDNVRDEMKELIENGDVDGLKALEKEVKKTDLEDEIKTAIKELK